MAGESAVGNLASTQAQQIIQLLMSSLQLGRQAQESMGAAAVALAFGL